MKKKILVLENDTATLEIIEMILEPEGFEIIKTSVQSLDADLPVVKPDLVVLDHMLNHMHTGGELCRMIKANEATKNIAVVLISAVNDLPEIAEKSCADAFVEKPFDISHFLQIVNQTIN